MAHNLPAPEAGAAPQLKRLQNRQTSNGIARPRWTEIRHMNEFRGSWVALSHCTFDDNGNTIDGKLVDYDEELSVLCSRLRDNGWTDCELLHID